MVFSSLDSFKRAVGGDRYNLLPLVEGAIQSMGT
jgi:hypothetical protein